MLYREIIAVCSQIHTKHINTLCGQNVELLNFELAVHIVTTGVYRVNKETVLQPIKRLCMSLPCPQQLASYHNHQSYQAIPHTTILILLFSHTTITYARVLSLVCGISPTRSNQTELLIIIGD